MENNDGFLRLFPEVEGYSISHDLEQIIQENPDVIDWLISSELLHSRHMMINNYWETE